MSLEIDKCVLYLQKHFLTFNIIPLLAHFCFLPMHFSSPLFPPESLLRSENAELKRLLRTG